MTRGVIPPTYMQLRQLTKEILTSPAVYLYGS